MNVQQQFTSHSPRPQQKLAQQLSNSFQKRQHIQETLRANKRSEQSTALPNQKTKARLHFTVAEEQALVLRRLLLSTAALRLNELHMTPNASKQIVKIALVLEAKAIDKVIHAVIRNMQSAEIGAIVLT